MVREYKICSKCILDTNDDVLIEFDDNGICNHCHNYDSLVQRELKTDANDLTDVINKIKIAGKNHTYDCILGVSGGVDSTYLAYLTKKMNLRPLIIHFDNGWNSELAVKNIENIIQKLNFDLHTYVINWEEFKDLQLSFLRASVVDIEVLTDHAIKASLFKLAHQYRIKYILNGYNVSTEGVLPNSWIWNKMDLLNIIDIHKKFGKIPLKTYPTMGLIKRLYYSHVLKIESIPLLNYINYVKKDVKKVIIEELGWKDYGGKHHESIFTRFYQSYILPKKFKIDKRKAHYSSLICSGQITREEALEEMKADIYDKEKLEADKEFVLKKLGLSADEFDSIMKLPIKSHLDYKSYIHSHEKYLALFLKKLRFIKKIIPV